MVSTRYRAPLRTGVMLLLSAALVLVGAPAAALVGTDDPAPPAQDTTTATPSAPVSPTPSPSSSATPEVTQGAPGDGGTPQDDAKASQTDGPGSAIPGLVDLTGKGRWVAANGRWQWRLNDGSLARSQWVRIKAVVYRFDDEGYVQTGWWQDGRSWYYLGTSGALSTGWTQVGTAWYYLDPTTGVMATGTLTVGGSTYFLTATGVMVTGWLKQDDGWHYYRSSGQQAHGWQADSGNWYYLDPATGVMATDWTRINGSWFYLNPTTGAMTTGWTSIGQYWFYLDPTTGAMATGWTRVGDSWFYLNPTTGAMATGTLTIDGSTYHFTSTGVWIGYQAPAGYLQPVSQITSLGWATNDLTWGMNGVKVRIVQQRLGLWYSTKLASVDASFQNAVRNFQRRVGLPQTGVVDQRTWNALDTGYSWWVDQYQATPVSLSATRSERIEAMIGYARDQLGSSYTWGGAGPYNLGFDCSGLSLQSLYRAGLDPQPIDVYKHAWPAYRTSQELYDHPGLMHVPLSQRQRGDLIFYTSEGVVTHVAIYLGDDQVIHTDWMGRPARVQHITVGYGWENMTGYVVRPFP